MGLFHGLEELRRPFKGAAVTIGNFDGVHMGHRALFNQVKGVAAELDGESVVVTFDPHPLTVLKNPASPAPEMIHSLNEKVRLISACTVNHVVVIPFNEEFSRIRAADFVRRILCERIGMKAIVIGHDYAFGYRREGNIDLLRDLSGELGFQVVLLEPVEVNGERVSSTTVRRLIKEGEMGRVRDFLGRPFRMEGEVVPGRKVGGAQLGFPTLNLEPGKGIVPGKGVYVVEVILDDIAYPAVCNVGVNPTFGLDRLSVEAHILDFNRMIYGERVKMDFLKKLRDERKFPDFEALSRQIASDVAEAASYFRGTRVPA